MMAQQQAEAVALLGCENQTARHSEIEGVRVRRKLTDDGGEGAALECFSHRPERVVGVTDAQVREVSEAEAELC